jgi:16S rRNA (cytosine967-C5)-methyltransferase
MINEREIIAEALMEILEKKKYVHLVVAQVLEKYSFLSKQQRSFIQRCIEGTVENLIRIDYVIDSFSKTRTAKMKPWIRTLLRMSVYQLMYCDSVPDAAVCNECVKLAAKRGFGQLRGFCNGVLRNIARNKASLSFPDRGEDITAFLSVTYSMPGWIVSMWIQRFGETVTENMLRGLLEERPLTIRFDETLSAKQRETLLGQMEEKGIKAGQAKELPYAYHLSHVDKVTEIPGYEEGLFAVQDTGSMLVVEMAKIRPGDRVLDICAAPGGKVLHAAAKTGETGRLQARDLTQEKIDRIEENITRCRYRNIETRVFDATVYDETQRESADVMIADLPCSGLGVIGRKSDIKYRVTPQDVQEIAALQRKILAASYSYVKPGGVLMFSTCTVTKEENEDNRDWLLANYPFVLEEERLILPGIEESDGFYMARFRRSANGLQKRN